MKRMAFLLVAVAAMTGVVVVAAPASGKAEIITASYDTADPSLRYHERGIPQLPWSGS